MCIKLAQSLQTCTNIKSFDKGNRHDKNPYFWKAKVKRTRHTSETLKNKTNSWKETQKTMKLNNKLYDILKWVAILALPAFTAFYSALGGIWGFAFTSEITQTLQALQVLLGALIGISTLNYEQPD